MKKNVTLFFVCIIVSAAKSQTISPADFFQSATCTDFECFEKTALANGLTKEESPYKDASGVEHRIFFNPGYEEDNIQVYSIGISLSDTKTTVFLKSKNIGFFENFINGIITSEQFYVTQGNTIEDETIYSTYSSKKDPGYEIRLEGYYDKEDATTYAVIKLTHLKNKQETSLK